MKIINDVCEITCVDEEKVNRLKSKLMDQNTTDVTKIFKALADVTRLKIAYSLVLEEPLCVCDVANIAGCSIASASHHLRTLKKLGLAKFKKEGKLVYYSLDDEHVRQLIEIAFIHHKEVALREPGNGERNG
ncbi:metalloregulator ArsR/SmtB family transcription factor [Bacillus sp. DTU_2020_1000418_1_SI_GHA_SEK_038]|uniref:ArsR/SmtB family transcription factor n=1 Tax=Bacillus sp. DTU_2020_1000418_1_SI_GHA_SEK_038 TaxID=3077585 RepID=UPI0028E5D7CC|nr:metalloregulator ArsR/SmtB family transcription factor [Bacillus sp. DTU_2020_1000418_1_SI_GHA_SEK_038]WNS76727.1 metalloregulator ArsR/SmtB family transcription factor [Bacillus sp. DTU_2020_1000418_1_SI_GHA_SEK_038]